MSLEPKRRKWGLQSHEECAGNQNGLSSNLVNPDDGRNRGQEHAYPTSESEEWNICSGLRYADDTLVKISMVIDPEVVSTYLSPGGSLRFRLGRGTGRYWEHSIKLR